MMATENDFSFQCPLPLKNTPNVLLAHGGGGSLMNQLIEKMFLTVFENPSLNQRHDAAVLARPGGRVAFTTDSYVIKPLFFPGGDIGTLAVHGTVNDLVMAGARPLYLSAGFILEEGLSMDVLGRITHSMQAAAAQCGVAIVTGDTKVVDQGKGDGIFINTAGIGVIEHRQTVGPRSVREGDVILLSGDLGRHGMAIMSVREGLEFESTIESDTAPLTDLVLPLFSQGIEVHCLRDLTRGGLASALNEIAGAGTTGMEIDESCIPVREEVRAACEILGLDPLYVANEGRCIAFVPSSQAPQALRLWQGHPLGAGAAIIGKVKKNFSSSVVLNGTMGSQRVIDLLSGEQLPRIC